MKLKRECEYREGTVVTCALPGVGNLSGCIVRGISHDVVIRFYIIELTKESQKKVKEHTLYKYSCMIAQEQMLTEE